MPLPCVTCAELCLSCWLLMEGLSLGVSRLGFRLIRPLYHIKFLSHCTPEINFVGYIVDNQIPVSGWFLVPWRCTVVWCIALEKFVYAILLPALLLFQNFCKYSLLLSQVGQWSSVLTHPRSPFFGNMISVPVQCLLRESPDKYGISDFWWRIHPSKEYCTAALYITMCGTCEDLFYFTISRILCNQLDS